jgi:diguanylate cyclase (GGDEF)-like protein
MHVALSSLSAGRARALTVVAALAVAAVGIAQVALNDGIAVWAMALPLVALAAWGTSVRRAGMAAVIGLASWVASAAIIAPEQLRDSFWYVNLGVRAAIIALVIVLAAGWRRALVHNQEVARTDAVTGLVTSREFFRLVDIELQRAQRYEHPFTVVYLCVEDVADVKARGRHSATDDVLRAAGRTIVGVTRGLDTVAWLRAGEIGVLMPETGPRAAMTALTRMRAALDAALRRDGAPRTVSMGAVTWIRTEITVDQLLQRSYQMLYAAQQAGGARCRHEVLDTADVLL